MRLNPILLYEIPKSEHHATRPAKSSRFEPHDLDTAGFSPYEPTVSLMTEFDPEKFEDKYVHYLTELESAYKRAFETMNDRFDSDLVHAIDQQVLNDSEPFYEGDGEFRIELPTDAFERVQGVLVTDEKFEAVLEEYRTQLRSELRRSFGFEQAP